MNSVIFASPNQYGYFTIYYNYARYLAPEVKIIYVCFDQGDEKFSESENIHVVYVSLNKNRLLQILRYYQAIIKHYKSSSSNKVVLKYYFLCSFLNFFIPGKDLILDIRTGYISKVKFKTLFFNLLLRIEAVSFKRITILSESLRKILKIRNSKSTIIPLGAEKNNFPEKEFNKISLLYVGTLTSRNINQTVEGLSEFIKSNALKTEISYHIVGGGKPGEEKTLNDIIQTLELEKIVHYEGQVYGEKLKDYFKKCNVGVSYIPMLKDYDWQPATKTVEYLMAGMPVLATATFENRRIINKNNGILMQDNPQSFAEALRKFIATSKSFESGIITASVEECTFARIIESKLKPLLFS